MGDRFIRANSARLLVRFLIFFSLLASFAFGQVTPRNLLSSHYTVDDVRQKLIARNDWKPFPKTSAEWKSRLPEAVVSDIIKKGEAAAEKDVPLLPATVLLEYVRTGNRSNYEAITFRRRTQLMDLVAAEAVEDKGRFVDAIVNHVWAICEETYWGIPAHLSVQKAKNGLPDADDPTVDLFGAETVAGLALTDYLVGDKLDKVSPLLRKRIYEEANRKIFEPIKQTKRYSWLDPTKQVNNWNPWIVSNLMAGQLLLEKDEAKRADNLYQYMKLLDVYLNGLGEDGGCDEGPSYWFAAGGSVFDALEILDSATAGKVNIYNETLVQKMASYIYKMHIADDYFVDFADADPKFSGDGILLYRYGKSIKDNALSQFGLYLYNRRDEKLADGRFQKPRHLFNLLTLKDLPAANSYNFTPPNDAWFADIQVMTARTLSKLFLATHAGHNGESHNHNDVGDFIVYLGNEPVIIDTGRGNYTARTFSSKRYELWFTQSQYHNLPVINGFGQLAGRNYTAEKVQHTANDKESSLTMDIAKAYPKEAGITYWNRDVKLNRADNTVDISDDYSLAKDPASLQQIFMTVCDIDISQPGRLMLTTPTGKKISIAYSADWTASIEKPSMDGMEYSSFISKWDNREIKRIVLTAQSSKSKNKLEYKVSVQ